MTQSQGELGPRVLPRPARSWRSLTEHARTSQGRTLIAGGVLVLAGLAMFAGLLDGVLERDDLSTLDSPVLGWLMARRTGATTATFARISSFADPVVLSAIVLVVIVVLVWRTRGVRSGLLLGGPMGIAMATSSGVKVLVSRSRPPTADMIAPFEANFAFPSGHTVGAATFLLVCAYLWWSSRPTVWVAVVGLAASAVGTALIALSRLYLGYHWLTDVSASVAIAVAILGAVIVVDPLLSGSRAARAWRPTD
ncbi:phosphatase PAP2 family protein [Pengzhenrongella sp.]|jgi:undecaprenyl-diphosphatase|uniref:phosphatase PAP2 family protein n=1 Tax=Pengzhenrongella sp. TaxID=2888820 RepID=UPI002F944B4C